MHLSTFNSEDDAAETDYTAAISAAIACLLLLLACSELAARVGFSTISRVESRTYQDHANALAVRRGSADKPTILLLGNSLLLEAMDYDRVRVELKNEADPTRFVIEQTAWLDWYYGIQRLLAEGARPDRLILCLNLNQFGSDGIRGDYSAYYLLQASDVTKAARLARYDSTRTSSLLLAHYSMLFAGLSNFRNFILNKTVPAYAATLRDFTTVKPMPLNDVEVVAKIRPRLEQLQEVCGWYGTRCDVLLPPGMGAPRETGFVEAGRMTKTNVLVPVPMNAWGKEMFRDGFHVNAAGAEKFTGLLIKALRQRSTGAGAQYQEH